MINNYCMWLRGLVIYDTLFAFIFQMLEKKHCTSVSERVHVCVCAFVCVSCMCLLVHVNRGWTRDIELYMNTRNPSQYGHTL